MKSTEEIVAETSDPELELGSGPGAEYDSGVTEITGGGEWGIGCRPITSTSKC